MEEVLMQSLKGIPSAIIGGIIGFFVKSFLEKRKKDKDLKESSVQSLREAVDLISSIILPLRRDIVAYTHFSKTLKNEEGGVPPAFASEWEEMVELSKIRLIENCMEVNNISVAGFKVHFGEIAEEVGKFQNTCRNLRRIMQLKKEKEALLNDIDAEIEDHYQKIMDTARPIY